MGVMQNDSDVLPPRSRMPSKPPLVVLPQVCVCVCACALACVRSCHLDRIGSAQYYQYLIANPLALTSQQRITSVYTPKFCQFQASNRICPNFLTHFKVYAVQVCEPQTCVLVTIM